MLIFLITTAIGLNSMQSVSPLLPGRSSYIDRQSLSISYMLAAQTEEAPSDTCKRPKENLSWMITEPLGAVAGAAVLGMAGAWSVLLRSHVRGESEANMTVVLVTMGIGYTVGSAMGVWLTGKYVEKEEGWLLIGSV
jgi:hypothetical protein